MLTIRGTLQLNSLTPLKIGSDMLSRKILGNYELMGPSVTAQDLLHMTMLPAEIYVLEGGGGHAFVSQNVTVENERRLELVNSFFNRILLLNTQDFTYQDQVFVSQFLRKIGITDTVEFVSQVQKLTEQNIHVTSLMEQYWTTGEKIHSLSVELLKLSKEPASKTGEEERPSPEVRYYLQQEVFRRLQTSFLNNFLYDTRRYIFQAHGQASGQEAVLSEQIQMADAIQLTELKQLVLMEEQPPVHQQLRFYEQAPILQDQMNEKTVMKYLGASVLTNFISQLSYSILEKREARPVYWVDYHRAFYGSSENTLQRFLELHGEQYRNYRRDYYMETVNRLYGDEVTVLNLFRQYQSQPDVADYPACQMVYALLELQNQEKQAEELLYQNTLPSLPRAGDGLSKEQPRREILTVLMEAEQRIREQSEQLPYLFLTQRGQPFGKIETLRERGVPKAEAVRETALIPESSTYSNIYQETVKNQFLTEADYKRYLDEINERNIYNQELLHNSRIEKQALYTIAVDRKTAIQKSLEALQQPEKVIQEMLSEGRPIERRANPEIERLLALAKEPVRKLYQQILYPEEAGKAVQSKETGDQEGLLHPAGALQMVPTDPKQLQEILQEVENSVRTPALSGNLKSGRAPGRERTKSREDAPVSVPRGEIGLKHPSDIAERGSDLEGGDEVDTRQERFVREIQMITRELRRAVSNLVWQPPEQSPSGTGVLQYVQALGAAAEETAGGVEEGGKRLSLPAMGKTGPERAVGQEAFDILHKVQTSVGVKAMGTDQRSVDAEQEPSMVNLVFKQESAPLEEEVIEQMTRNSRVVHQQQENTTEIIKNSTVIQEKLQETRQEILMENQRNITELIQRSLQSQMSTISDQVYRNLERRLFNERKRRGY